MTKENFSIEPYKNPLTEEYLHLDSEYVVTLIKGVAQGIISVGSFVGSMYLISKGENMGAIGIPIGLYFAKKSLDSKTDLKLISNDIIELNKEFCEDQDLT